MKLIVAGASGFLGTEIVRQSLSIPSITTVIALSRKPVSTPADLGPQATASKLQSVVIKDYDSYPEDVLARLAGADACIWTVSITPTKARGQEFSDVRRVCHDYTLAGLSAVYRARGHGQIIGTNPLRFVYLSGIAAERDQTKTPGMMPEYSLMRGETENHVLAYAAERKGALEACVAKPGIIAGPGRDIAEFTKWFPSVDVTEVAAALLQQVEDGFEKEPLINDDLVRLGRKVLDGGT